MIRPGTFFFIQWPQSDNSVDAAGGFTSKGRAVMAITEPDDHGDVMLLKVTGSPHCEKSVPFSQEDLEIGRLVKPSYIRTDRFLTVHYSVLRDLGAAIRESKLRECHKALALRHARTFSRMAHVANRPGDDPMRPENAERTAAHSLQAGGPAGISASSLSVPYAGRVFTEDEVEAAVSATLDFWLTLGKEGEAFEKELAQFLGVRHSLLVNSGSSANLIALSCLTTHKLPGHKRIRPGDEVITCAAGFPTTVAPILQNGCIPVFIDNDPATGNARVEQLEAACHPGKTKAVMMAHTLGNPFNISAVLAFCKKYDLWLIEDNCDALGCTYSMPVEMAKELGLDHLLKIAKTGEHPLIRFHSGDGDAGDAGGAETGRPPAATCLLTAPTGAWGDLSTQSFYPPHHLTMGEGGAVNIIRHPPLKTYAESFRDWGRDCWCSSGKDNTCGKRFGWQLGELPRGYDHKYIYTHLGYNLKPLDPQAAIGRVQLRRLPAFIEARKQNWEILRRGLADLDHVFDFSLPTHATGWISHSNEMEEADRSGLINSEKNSGDSNASSLRKSAFSWDSTQCRTQCSWFGFMLRVRSDAPFTVMEFAAHMDEHKIGNRMLFGGNLLRQPAFVQLHKDNPQAFRVVDVSHRDGKDEGDEGEKAPGAGQQAAASSGAQRREAAHNPPLSGADSIMHSAIFLGTYPGLSQAQLDYEIGVVRSFVESKNSQGGK